MMKQIKQKSSSAKKQLIHFSSLLSLQEMKALKGGGDGDDDIIIEEIIEG